MRAKKDTDQEELVIPEIMQITTDNPLIITTQAQLEQVMFKVLEKCGINALLPEPRKEIATEMPTRLARKFLQERGYRVISDPVFNALISEYKVSRRKRGKENWYSVSDLQNIPPRI